MVQLSETGTSAVVIISDPKETRKILLSAKRNAVMNSTSVVYIVAGAISNASTLDDAIMSGSIGVGPFRPESAATAAYDRLWAGQDPGQPSLEPATYNIVDAVFALAVTFQMVLNDSTSLDGASLQVLNDAAACHIVDRCL